MGCYTNPGSATSMEPLGRQQRWNTSTFGSASSAFNSLMAPTRFHGATTAPFLASYVEDLGTSERETLSWLASLYRCWTGERRTRHGLPHDPKCRLCDQEMESLDHLLAQCVFSRIT